MYKKLTKCPKFTWFLPEKFSSYPNFMIFARKVNKIPEFCTIFAWKMPEFYIIIARQILFSFLGRGGVPSPALRLLRLCRFCQGKGKGTGRTMASEERKPESWGLGSCGSWAQRGGSGVDFTNPKSAARKYLSKVHFQKCSKFSGLSAIAGLSYLL